MGPWGPPAPRGEKNTPTGLRILFDRMASCVSVSCRLLLITGLVASRSLLAHPSLFFTDLSERFSFSMTLSALKPSRLYYYRSIILVNSNYLIILSNYRSNVSIVDEEDVVVSSFVLLCLSFSKRWLCRYDSSSCTSVIYG